MLNGLVLVSLCGDCISRSALGNSRRLSIALKIGGDMSTYTERVDLGNSGAMHVVRMNSQDVNEYRKSFLPTEVAVRNERMSA
jgi:hypothetical protein